MPALVALLAETWIATYVRFYGAEKVGELIAACHSPERISANLSRTDGEYLVADDGERIGGMAFATPSGQGDVKSVKLHQLYVHPDFQRSGIGRDLFAEIEICFPDAKRLIVEVEPENEEAIAFYRGVGMREAGSVASCGGHAAIPALLMEKDLPNEGT